MGGLPLNPDPASIAASNPTKIKIGPVEVAITLPKWAVAGLSILILVASAVFGAYIAYTKVSETLQEEREKSAKTLNSVLVPKDDMLAYQEQTNHSGDDEPDQQEVKRETLVADGSITIHHYFKDGCVEIIRHRLDSATTDMRWIFGPAVKIKDSERPKPVDAPQATRPLRRERLDFPEKDNQRVSGQSLDLSLASFSSTQLLKDAVYRATNQMEKPLQSTPVYYQGCLNPHPGGFNYSNQVVNQCLIQVWRYFPDGCIHFQYFNPCTGGWDINPDGSPRVNWTRCVH